MSPKSPTSEHDQTQTSTGKTHLLAEGSLLAGRYRIGDVLGLGGMGMVYRARDETLDVDVALKVLRDEHQSKAEERTVDRFQQELLLARQVSHRNVVRIHDIGRDGTVHFLTMDLVQGRSLRDLLDADGPLPVARALDIARQLAEGLAAAHEKGIIHRDLKPANILIDADYVPYITDFGVARSLSAPGLTRTGHIVGTPDYLSPEQARGGEVDARSDIYSLGLILYEMLSAQLPFSGETYQEVLAQRTVGKPRDLASAGIAVPSQVSKIIQHCLATQPADRYESASQLAGDLADGAVTRIRRTARRRVLSRATAVALVALLTMVAGWLLWSFLDKAPKPPESAVVADTVLQGIAILPLQDLTGRPDLGWLGNGLPELVADRLSDNPELRVVDSNRVYRTLADLKMLDRAPSEAEIRQAAELLGANIVVTGAVRTAGEQVRVDARVVHPGTASSRQQSFTAQVETTGQVFELVGKLTLGLRRQLEVSLPEASGDSVMSESRVALEAYTSGMRELHAGNSLEAEPLLEAATREDPQFAAAWLRLSEAREALGFRDKSLEAIRTASRLRPEDSSRIGLEIRAREALLNGDLQQAQDVLARLVQRFPSDTESRITLALAHEDEGELDEAMQVLSSVLESDPNHPRAWYLMGKYAILTGNSQAAIDEYLVRALVIQNRLGNEQGRADVLNAMGIAYHRLGQLDQALEPYRQAAEIRTRIGDRRGVASSLTNLGRILADQGQFEAARERFDEAASNREAIGDRRGLALLHNEYGLLEEGLGRYREALDHFRRALQIRRDLGDKRALTESYSNVGFAYYTLGEYDNAEVYWRQAMDTASEIQNEEDIVLATQNIALLDVARGEWDRALKGFLASLEQGRRLGNPFVQAVAMGNLGRIAMLQGRFGAAEQSLGDAGAMLAEVGDRRGQAEYGLFRMQLMLTLGMATDADQMLTDLRVIIEEAGNREQQAEALRMEAEIAMMRDNREEAEQAFEAALSRALESGNPVARLRTELGAARAGMSGQIAKVRSVSEIAAEIAAIGNAPLHLEAMTVAAIVAAESDPAGDALATSRKLLEEIAAVGDYHGSWRAHALLASALSAEGQIAAAREARAAAELELRRIQHNMMDTQRQAFRQLPAVRDLEYEI